MSDGRDERATGSNEPRRASEPARDADPVRAPSVGSDRASPYPVSRLSPRFELVDAAREIAAADLLLAEATSGKLAVILEQVRALQAQARSLLEEAKQAQDLHRAECRFKRVPGRVYHLYRRESGARYFSMLAPEDWGGAPPHPFEGSYRLEADMTFTPADRIAAREAKEREARGAALRWLTAPEEPASPLASAAFPDREGSREG